MNGPDRRRRRDRREVPAGHREDPGGPHATNVDGDSNYVRVQVLTNFGALHRGKQLAVIRQLTGVVAAAAGDPALADRTLVLLTEAPDGGGARAGTRTPTRNSSAPHAPRSQN